MSFERTIVSDGKIAAMKYPHMLFYISTKAGFYTNTKIFKTPIISII